ncbi:ABC transporter ATP-binding protein [Brevibacillus formosus]|uniref:ABC transporter ATP-binding protein n=2 Tax=Brevibacillus formosus TaxID=54913 RepID=A0A837KP07_9BACL|nr:ABC transporter ATP-binding protein [Brevibacillus formosus]PSJ92966.1 ABC transporter ATP-binding protein [Brevibacillus formosus]GED57200.1 ABC transporter permease [Brevibacillus formosus]
MYGPTEDLFTLKTVIQSFRNWPKIFRLFWTVQKGYFITIVILNILQGLFPVGMLYVTQELVNAVSSGISQDGDTVVISFLFFISFILVKQLVTLIQNYVEGLFQSLLSNRLREMVLDKANAMGLADFENAEVQDQLKRAQQETSYRPYQIFELVLSIVSGVISLVSTSLFLIFWKWWVVFILVLFPLISFYSYLRLSQQEFYIRWSRAERERRGWYISHLLTHDRAFKEVQIYKLGSYLITQFRDMITQFFYEDKKIATIRLKTSLVFESLTIAMIGFMSFIAIKAAFLKEILLGNLVSYIQGITLTQTTSQSLMHSLIGLSQHNMFVEQLFLFLERNSSDPVKLQKVAITTPQENDPFVLESIEFVNVSFTYPETARPVLQNLSFKIRKGESLAIVGENGSGKTTLVKLLTLLYKDYEGQILINGTDLNAFDMEQIRAKIGVVFQDFMQYEMSIRNNVGFGDLSLLHQDDKLYHALEKSGMRSLAEGFEQGLDTQLGKWFTEGLQLSGGQWQRIAIARAFLRNADLYILDEPSASLDPMAEKEVFDSFNLLTKERMGIFISHRYSSAQYADQIMVLDQGRIVEFGTHTELIRLQQKYASLYNLQASPFVSQS